MSDFLKRVGRDYALSIMQGYVYPPNQRTEKIEWFINHVLYSQDYDDVGNFLNRNANRYMHQFNRQQIRSIAHYAQYFARRFRDELYCSLAKQKVL